MMLTWSLRDGFAKAVLASRCLYLEIGTKAFCRIRHRAGLIVRKGRK